MTIKDVEKRTGLTVKSIRYYEKKGLVSIKRNTDNDYREFTEEDICRFKLIKILRYLNFSIDDIAAVFKADNLAEALREKIKCLEAESNAYIEKQSICKSLLKDCKKKEFAKVIEDYSDTVNFLESEDGENLKSTFMEALCPNMSALIVQSLIYMAPVIWLFINIYHKNWAAILMNSIIALFSLGLLVANWLYYLDYTRKHREAAREKNRKNSLAIPVLIISVIIVIMLFVLLNLGLEHLLAPQDFLFFETPLIITKAMISAIVILAITSVVLILKKLKVDKTESLDIYLELWKRFKYVLLILLAIITYCFVTSVTFVTANKIIYRDPFHPFGVSYDYSDVTRIETGFGDKSFSFVDYERKGQFYYRIYVGGKTITFSTPSTNERIEKYENDSYLELEEFDMQLMKYDIEKVSDDTYASACDLDKQFCDRFIRIINNR